MASISGEILETKQIAQVKEKRNWRGKDVYEISIDDLKNLRSTAMKAVKCERERDVAVAMMEEAKAETAEAKERLRWR